jgi:hypothetical protein
MSAQVTISSLPTAGAITGSELVPIVQNGVTVQTTTGAIAASPSQTQTFITLNQEPTLPNSRRLSGGTGVGLVDGGAQSTLQITLNGASGSLESASTGVIVKTSSNTVTARSIATTGSGISITNGSGVSGNPTIGLTGLPLSLASIGGTSLLAVIGGSSIAGRQIYGTSNQITVTNGDGSSDPVISIPSNPTLPGTGAVLVPNGTNAQKPVGSLGQFRYNSDIGAFEGYTISGWSQFSTATAGVTLLNTGTGLLGGPITSTGTIDIDTTVVATLTGVQTLTNKSISGSTNTLTNIGNSSLTNSAITINGSSVSLGGSVTVTATASSALTIGTGLSGSSYNGSAPVTIAIDSTVATLTGTQTLTNKSISGSTNTLTNIPNSALTNSSVTVGTTAISLGSSSLTLGGLSSVTVTADPTTAFQLATKQYVDTQASTGLTYHQPVQAATTASLASTTGGTVTYNNGSSGVGATITLSVALTVLDGYTLLNTNRVLIKNETNQTYNGVYTWATGGTVLTRATDADTYGPGTTQLSVNDYFFTQNGTVNKGVAYVLSSPTGTITFGTSNIVFSEFSTSQVYTGTSPISISGTVISLNTVPVASGGTNITSYSTGDLLYASGTTTLSKLTIGTANYVLTSSGTAPQYVAQSTLSVGSATNATNTAITANSTNAANYLTFVSATSGNLGQLVNSSITCNPSTGAITGGISGGTF